MRRLIMSLVFLAGGVTAVLADSESDGAAAEKAGKYREALGHYTSALQAVAEGSEQDQQLREKIIEVAAKLKPAPVVPEEVARFMARGRAAVGAAKDQQGFERAANEFRQALKLAPWLADAYYNLGVVLDKAEKYPEAIQNLKLYLHARRDAPDARQVQELIYEVEYRQEESGRAGVEKKSEATDLSALSGAWTVEMGWALRDLVSARDFSGPWIMDTAARAQISTSGRTIRITRWYGEWRSEYEGIVNARNISGTVTFVRPPVPPDVAQLGYRDVCNLTKFPFEGAISENAAAIVLIEIGGAVEDIDETNRLITCKPGTFHPTYRLSR
ncbi:MAG: tetratricopeptide repeat protein [Pseudomonadota bacterium]